MTAVHLNQPEPGAVLCKALRHTQEALALSNEELGKVIGKDRTTISRLFEKGYLAPQSKEGELATLLIRVYRSLYALVGGAGENMRHWLDSPNTHLNGTPRELLSSVTGLVLVLGYLDAMRGRI